MDKDPKWHKQTGDYIAKKQRCGDCGTQQTKPQNPDIKYVTYNAVMVGITRIGKPYFRPYLPHPNFDPLELSKTQDAKAQRSPDSATSVAAQGPVRT